MDKLQFREKTLTADYKLKTTANLFSYNIHANENEIVRLDISTDGDEILNDMPVGTKNCNELIWDEQFAKDINAHVTDIFIVSLEDGKYRISTVERASYFFSSDEEISFGDEKFGWSFDLGEFDSNTDLLTYGLKSRVKFSFADDLHCPGEYHFYKSTKGRNLSENEMVVVPTLGVIRNYTISKKLNRNLREVDLQKVNDIPLTTFMEQACTKTTETTKVTSVEEKEVVKKTSSTKTVTAKTDDATMATTSKKVAAPKTVVIEEKCSHIYRNADTGFYYDRNTGLPAEGDCGGITYAGGLMQNSDYQQTTVTTELVSNAPLEEEFVAKGGEVTAEPVTKTVESETANTEVIKEMPAKEAITEASPKVVYKQPKVIYKEVSPIVIDESIEPQDTKIISRPSLVPTTANLDCTVSPRTGYHLVKKGETLYKISNLYSVSIEDLISWNGLKSNTISVCQHLKVQAEISLTQNENLIPANEFVSKGGPVTASVAPVTKTIVTEEAPATKSVIAEVAPVTKTIVTKEAPVKRVYHYIAQGETLYGISKQYNVNVEELKTLNKITDNFLKPGWRLLIPNTSDKANSTPAEPTVKPIIKEVITPATEMTPKGGSSMKIPEASEERLNSYQNQHIYHTVAENETIGEIAMKYGTSTNALKILNEMGEGEVLIPYQKIKVR